MEKSKYKDLNVSIDTPIFTNYLFMIPVAKNIK